MKSTAKALLLDIKEVFDPEFIKEVIDRKMANEASPREKLLRSARTVSSVRNRVMFTFVEKTGVNTRLAELASYTPSELRRMVKLGDTRLRWLEEYLNLLGVVLPETRTVHGMRKEVKAVIAKL